jgi:hypothetical protein
VERFRQNRETSLQETSIGLEKTPRIEIIVLFSLDRFCTEATARSHSGIGATDEPVRW